MPKIPGIPGLKAQQRKRPAKYAPAANRLNIAVGLGSTGANFEKRLRRFEPRFRGATMAVDAEISPADAAQFDHLVATPDRSVADFKPRASRVPLIRDDELLPTLLLPHDSERGAGACRPLGTIKASVVLDSFRQKLNRIVRRRLLKLDTQERLIVDVHIVSASCGGFGSGLITPLALIARDEVRKVAPQARCSVIVHLVLSSLFEPTIADPRIRQKVVANDFGTLLELNFAQAPANVEHLAELLGCEPLPVPTFDRVTPYHVSDEVGKTATVDGILSERILPNVVASENSGLADRLREVASNTLALQHGGGGEAGVVHPFVATSQAAAARTPDQFGECWAVGETRTEVETLLAKPSAERVKSFEGPLKTALRIEANKTEIARACSEPLNDVLIQAGSLRKKSALEAHAILTETYERYHSAVKTTIEARCRTIEEHHESVKMPAIIDAMLDALVERGATIGEVALAERNLRKEVDDYGDRVNKEAEKASIVVKVCRERFNELMQKLLTKPWLAGRVNEQAAEALNNLINAENVVQRHRTLHRAVRIASETISGAEAEVLHVHREAVRAVGALKARQREARELATLQSTTITSIIKPEEFDAAVARLDRGIRAVNESLPRLDVKAFIKAGHLGVGEQVESVVDRRIELFDNYFESALSDVSGAVKALRLSFSVQGWIEATLKGLTCCSPVGLAAAGEAEPQTVVVACGDDLEAVQSILRRNPLLALVDAVPGTDPRMIVLHRRVEGLTIEAVPTFNDARRAARAFPKPAAGLPAWQTLASSGHVLGAFEQEGLVPDEWLAPPDAAPAPAHAPARLRRVREGLPDRVGTNGNGDAR